MGFENFNQFPQPIKPEQQEEELLITPINPDNKEDIAAYYQFEIDQDFSRVDPRTTFEKMVDFRQQQIKDGQLKVLMVKKGDQLIATSVIVLESGTMGKVIKNDEAWASGTVVDKTLRGQGLGEKIATEQDNIALAAGKQSILTKINNGNVGSMRLRMKVGYQLEGVDKRETETSYLYRKNLSQEQSKIDWKTKVGENPTAFASEINETSPDTILLNQADDQAVQQAVTNGYRGVYLLTAKELGEQNGDHNNLIVFTREKINEH